MSVLICHRSNCDNVMCDQMILGNYICTDCLRELLKAAEQWSKRMPKSELNEMVEKFFDTPLGRYDEVDPVEEIKSLVRPR